MTTDRRPSALTLVGTRKFERLFVVIVAVFGMLYASQNADSLAALLPARPDPLTTAVIALGIASTLIALVAAFVPGRASFYFRAALGSFAIALLVWPFTIHSAIPTSPMPWFVAMWPIEAAYLVVVGSGVVLPVVVSVATAVYVGTILSLVGRLDLGDVVANGLFMAASSGVLLLLVRSIRQGVARADAAQDAALGEYGRTRFDDAAEAERIRTDALVHDSVITTFLSAADARTPDSQQLARRMASNALRVLGHVNRTAEMGPAMPFRLAFADASGELSHLLPHFAVRHSPVDDVVLPTTVNDALIGALAQAMANSVEHAEAAHRTVEFSELGADGIRIVIADDGVGFDVADAVASRLGVRVSIVERLRRVDGRADVVSVPGRGTTVTLSWGSAVISGTAPLADEQIGAVRA